MWHGAEAAATSGFSRAWKMRGWCTKLCGVFVSSEEADNVLTALEDCPADGVENTHDVEDNDDDEDEDESDDGEEDEAIGCCPWVVRRCC